MIFIAYNPVTGEVEARITVPDLAQAALQSPNLIAIDKEDYDSSPETWAEIDLDKKTIHPKAGKTDPTSKGRKPKEAKKDGP